VVVDIGAVCDYFFSLDMTLSQQDLVGDHWDDWTKGAQPVLLVRGERSDVLTIALPARPVVCRRSHELRASNQLKRDLSLDNGTLSAIERRLPIGRQMASTWPGEAIC
jgi:hypothetical protein